MCMPINPLGHSCIKKLQRDNLLHAYNEPINVYSAIEIKKKKRKSTFLCALTATTR